MKKLLLIMTVFVLLVTLIACGGPAETGTPDSDVPGTDAPETDAPETDAPLCNGKDIHDVEVVEVLATCQMRGYRKETCKVCGEEIVNTAYPKTECTPVAAPTCTEASVCSVCGEVVEEATGHTLGEAVVVEATCLAEGSKTQTCATCGETVVETIPMVAHNIPDGNVIASTDSTCSTAGMKTGTCTLCNQEQTVELPKLAHSFNDGTYIIGTDGSVSGTCTLCGEEGSVVQETRIQLDFDAADLSTEIAEHENSELYGFRLIKQKGEAMDPRASVYRAVEDRTVMETTQAIFLEFNSKVFADSSYYIISFDLALNNLEKTYEIKPSMISVVAGDPWTFFPAIKYESNMRKLAGIRANTDAVTDENSIDVEQGQFYRVTIVTNAKTGKASVYVDGQLLSVLGGCPVTEASIERYNDRFGLRFPESNGNKPHIDNFKLTVVK